MRQIDDFADDRNKNWCVYCGGAMESRDHVPSRVFLDEPYPDNLPFLPSCLSCNNSFSLDEEYLACLVDVAKAGSVELAVANRQKISRILAHTPRLAIRLLAARSETADGIMWTPEDVRVHNVILKLARGHIAFEQNEPQLDEPTSMFIRPLCAMSSDALRSFEVLEEESGIAGWPEVGSRAMIRLIEGSDDGFPWIEVQPGRYRYLVSSGEALVRLVIAEYLAAEVQWA